VRVLILTNEFPPTVYGGAGVHVRELTNALRGRVELDVRTFGDHAHDEPGWRVHGYPASPDVAGAPEELRPVLSAFSRNLAMAADAPTADLVHCHTWYTHLGGLVIGQAYGLPLVVTVHSLEPLRPWKREQLGGGYDASAWVEREALEGADAVIADRHIHASTSQSSPHVEPLTWRERLGLRNGMPVILVVGKRSVGKGTPWLLDAMKIVHSQAPQAVLVSVGKGPELKPGPGIISLSSVGQAELRALYSLADVVVVPSVWPEPFSRVMIESMSAGKLLVATNVGGSPEGVETALTGWLVPPGQPQDLARALLEAVNLPRERREGMCAAARTLLRERFAPEKSLKLLLQIYSDCQERWARSRVTCTNIM
jgi:glycosyltransferase involved in cell wall biosynthesis